MLAEQDPKQENNTKKKMNHDDNIHDSFFFVLYGFFLGIPALSETIPALKIKANAIAANPY